MSNPDFNFFSAYFSSTADMRNSFDWEISDAIDINSIYFSKRNKPFLRFLKTFRDAKIFSGGSPEQITHLLHVLQQSIRYFASDHERMRETINAREAKINSLNNQIRNLQSRSGNSAGRDIYFCPVCMIGLDSYHAVDAHIETQHPTIAEKWKEIRHPSISQSKSNIPTSTASYVDPGTKKITQDDVLNVVGQKMHQKLQDNSLTYQDLKNEMNVRFQELADILNANDYSYSNYYTIPNTSSSNREETQQTVQKKRRRRKSHSKTPSESSANQQSNTQISSSRKSNDLFSESGTYSYSTVNSEPKSKATNSLDYSYS